MNIRKATLNDVDSICSLYRDTISIVNLKHYSLEQVNAWASRWSNLSGWVEKIKNQHFLLAEKNEVVVGFCSITELGHIDMLFVHNQFQGQGIAGRLLSAIEQFAITQNLALLTTDASITACPVFEHLGFAIVASQNVTVNGVELTNYKMKKDLMA